MEKHDLTHLETRVKELCQGLKDVANDTDFQEFLRIIHRPGWTTPAELAFVGALVLGTGFFTLFAPWWLRTVRELTNERRERSLTFTFTRSSRRFFRSCRSDGGEFVAHCRRCIRP